jgi:hypothetical protein
MAVGSVPREPAVARGQTLPPRDERQADLYRDIPVDAPPSYRLSIHQVSRWTFASMRG